MEVAKPVAAEDWSRQDREDFTERWHLANLRLMCQATRLSPQGARALADRHFKTIVQRAAAYDWFDQVRIAQGHEVVWAGTAWVVASQFAKFDTVGNAIKIGSFKPPLSDTTYDVSFRGNFEGVAALGFRFREITESVLERDPGRALKLGRTYDDLVTFANAGNKQIFEDVYSSHLPNLFRKGLLGQRLIGQEAVEWDKQMVETEQRTIVEPVYVRHGVTRESQLGKVLNEMVECEDFLTLGQWAGGALAMCQTGFDVTNAADRVRYGLQVMVPFYRSLAKGKLREKRAKQAHQVKPPITCP